jgi:hypothetical protein
MGVTTYYALQYFEQRKVSRKVSVPKLQ